MKKDSLLVLAWKGLPGQLRELRYILPAYSLLILALLGLIWVISSHFDIEFEMFTRDLSSIAGGHPLYGVFSTLGIILWASAASVCWFTYFIYRKNVDKTQKRFLLLTAILTLWLLLDDAFEIHEFMAPYHLHIQQEYIYGIYIILIIGYMIYFFRSILKTEYFLFFLACLFIGLSVGLDFLVDYFGKEVPTAVEDGLKFFGVGVWFLYCVRISAGTVQSLSTDQKP